MTCKICKARRPRRFCPGVRGDICSICCGTEREVTVHCPFDCEYLQEARRHERAPELDPKQMPNTDITVSEEFVAEHEPLIAAASLALLEGAANTQGAVDNDVREALATLVRTYRTLESGLIYETYPTNPLAANIHVHVCNRLQEIQRQMRERTGMATVRDAEILGVLVFLQRLALQYNNGRPRGRAFLDLLRTHFGDMQSRLERPASPLIVR